MNASEQISAQFSILSWRHNIIKIFRKKKTFENLAQVSEILQTKPALTVRKQILRCSHSFVSHSFKEIWGLLLIENSRVTSYN